MIKIIKANNIYGISSLNGADKFDKLNVIYAPNGTAKSSIADAIENISIGKPVNDVYGKFPDPSYEFEIDGSLYNESTMVKFDVIKYCGVEAFDLKSEKDYSNLVISPSAKKCFSSSIDSINNSLNKIEDVLLSCFKKRKGKGEKFSKNLKEALMVISGSEENITLNFALNFNTSVKPLGEIITEEELLDLANSKGKTVLQNIEVATSIANYAAIISKKTVGKIIDKDFDIDKLNAFKKHVIEDAYFDDSKKRLLNIDGTNIGKDRFMDLVEAENLSIYGTEDMKEELDKCRDAMNKNAGFTKFSNTLLKKPSLIKHSLDYVTFVNQLFVTFLGAKNTALIESEIINIKKEQASIESKFSSESGDDNVLHGIWDKFKSRFKFNKFELRIKNKFDAITGKDLPRLIKCQKGTDIEIIDPFSLRFSTGEVRSYNLINFIIEVERMLLLSHPFTIVLDDPVDSFDYKNKYGIIDYLLDIKDNPLVQIIVLTHNFDFYRSVILSLGKKNVNQYFMYKDNAGNVSLSDVKSNSYYLQVTGFNSWKNSKSNINYLSFIPFLRNILQLQTNSSDPDVIKVDKYLHYETDATDDLDFSVIEPLMAKSGFVFPKSMNQSDKYLEKLDSIAKDVALSEIKETDLEFKIALGLYIRIFLERFLFKRIKKKGGLPPSAEDKYSRTASLIKIAKKAECLSDDELSTIIEANTISPSYVHANSFMYEPLIDVEATTLIDIASKIRNLNSKI